MLNGKDSGISEIVKIINSPFASDTSELSKTIEENIAQ
jgi:hypothetical protein